MLILVFVGVIFLIITLCAVVFRLLKPLADKTVKGLNEKMEAKDWSKLKDNKKKVLVSVLCIAVCLGVLFGVKYYKGIQWEKDFYISGGEWVANGFKNGWGVEGSDMFDVVEKGNPYYEYEIHNETNHKMSNVHMVFQCHGIKPGGDKEKWEYEFYVGYLNPHETKAVRVYHWDLFPKEYEDDDTYITHSYELERVTYKKS